MRLGVKPDARIACRNGEVADRETARHTPDQTPKLANQLATDGMSIRW